MHIDLFIDQLTNVGLDMAMEQMTGKSGAWSSDWAITGPLIEEMKPTLMFSSGYNAVEEAVLPFLKDGIDYAPWSSMIDNDRSSVNESGATALQAFVRSYLALQIDGDLRIDVNADTALMMLRDMDPVIQALYMGSNKHSAVEVGPDLFVLRPLSGSRGDLEAFESVVRMLDVVDGQGIRRLPDSSFESVNVELI